MESRSKLSSRVKAHSTRQRRLSLIVHVALLSEAKPACMKKDTRGAAFSMPDGVYGGHCYQSLRFQLRYCLLLQAN
jgi:hypothetical protein